MTHPNFQFWLFASIHCQPVLVQAFMTPHRAMNNRTEKTPPKFCHKLMFGLHFVNLLSPRSFWTPSQGLWTSFPSQKYNPK